MAFDKLDEDSGVPSGIQPGESFVGIDWKCVTTFRHWAGHSHDSLSTLEVPANDGSTKNDRDDVRGLVTIVLAECEH